MKNPTLGKLPQLLLLNFLAKFVSEKKTSNEHFNLCKAEISLNEIIKSINFETNEKMFMTPGESLTPGVLLLE